MRKVLRWEIVLLALGALSMGSGCPLIPEIKDKVVQLAVGGSTTTEWVSDGEVNTHDDSQTVDIKTDIDLPKILSDAGIDVLDVDDIKVSGISYRVTAPDPEPTRRIVNGQVTVRRGAGAETPIVTNFNVLVNSATTYQTATVDPLGVDLINTLLDDILTELQSGISASPTQITYHVTGQSTPTGVPTHFTWQLKLDLSIVGKVKVKTVG
jgi:hypothetical protein